MYPTAQGQASRYLYLTLQWFQIDFILPLSTLPCLSLYLPTLPDVPDELLSSFAVVLDLIEGDLYALSSAVMDEMQRRLHNYA